MKRLFLCIASCLLSILTAAILVAGSVSLGMAATSLSVDDMLLRGADLHYNGKLGDAAAMFEKVVTIEPRNEFALNQLALVYAKQEKFSEAERLFGTVASMSAQNTFARIWLGVLALRRDAIADAQRIFSDVLRIDPSHAGACYFLGVIYSVEHNTSEAVRWFRKAQELGSDDPETHFRLAQAFLSMDMPVNAQLEFQRTLKLHASHTKAMTALGWLYWNTGRQNDALALWKKALSLNPDDYEVRTSLAKVHNEMASQALRNGNKEEAAALWKKTLTYEKGNKAAKYHLRKLGM